MNLDKAQERLAKLQADIEREQNRAAALTAARAAAKLIAAREYREAHERACVVVDILEALSKGGDHA